MTLASRIQRWERWGTSGDAVLGRSLAVSAVTRLAKELHGNAPSLAAGALVGIAANGAQPAAGRAFEALVAACEDPRLAGEVFHQCLLRSGGEQDEDGRTWSTVAAPLLFEGSPARLVRFLDREPAGDHEWTRPEGIVDDLVARAAFDSHRRRPELERFLATTDHPLVLRRLAAEWGPDTSPPRGTVLDATLANPHLDPADVGAGNALLAVAKDRPDLVDLTRNNTVDALLRGTRLPGAGLADRYRRLLRELPPGVAREHLCAVALRRTREAEEARAAAAEADYAPERERDRVVFYYLTEQWDRYDAIDPDGELLYAAYLAVHDSADPGDHDLTWNIINTARRNDRPDPAARYVEEHPEILESRETNQRRGPIGGYSSDYGGSGIHT